MRRLASTIAVLAALALGACGLPGRDRIQQDLQVIANAGAPPDGVTVEVTSVKRGQGDFEILNHHVDYDLKVWRDGQLIGPLVGGVADVRAGGHRLGGKAVVVYEHNGQTWSLSGLQVERPPSPAPPKGPR